VQVPGEYTRYMTSLNPPLMGTLIEGPKRRHEEEVDLEMGHKRQHVAPSRTWNVNGSIPEGDISGCYYLVPGQQNAAITLITAVEDDQFVLRLSGARGSGKSTRLRQ